MVKMSVICLTVSCGIIFHGGSVGAEPFPVLGKVQHDRGVWEYGVSWECAEWCEATDRKCFGVPDIFYNNVNQTQIKIDRGGVDMYDERCYYYDWDGPTQNWVLAESDCMQFEEGGHKYTWWYEDSDIYYWDMYSNNWIWFMAYAYKVTSSSSWKYIWTYLQ
jgi:hypothetical protein